MLDRYEWRHNGVLSYLYKTFKDNKPDMIDIFADLDGAKISGGTIPPHIVTTAQRPDIGILQYFQLKKWGKLEQIWIPQTLVYVIFNYE